MSTPGPNAAEAQKIIQRGRAKAVAIICQRVEELELEDEAEDTIKNVVKEEINRLADGICAMLPSIVDEDVTVNALALEVLSEIRSTLEEIRTG